MLELRLLGRFVVLRAGREVPPSAFGGRKVRTLLRILATQRGSLVSHDALTDMLWPGQPPADPAANLGVLVHRARHALGDASLLVTGPGGYALADGDACRVDGEEFLASVAACQRLAGRQALAGYRSALATWGGEPLAEDLYADWATDYRRRLAQARQEALERAAGLAIEFGDPAVAVELAATAAQSEPLRERAALTLVKALAAAGDPAAALEQYDAYRRARPTSWVWTPRRMPLRCRGRSCAAAFARPGAPARAGFGRWTTWYSWAGTVSWRRRWPAWVGGRSGL